MRTAISDRVKARRWALPMAVGFVALACSGSVTSKETPPGGGGAGGSSANGVAAGPGAAGNSSPGGALSLGGALSVGGSAPATAGSASFAGGGGAHPIGLPPCDSPRLDPQTQLVVCANGFAHRAQGGVCPVPGDNPAGAAGAESGGATGDSSTAQAGAPATAGPGNARFDDWCSQDSDCVAGLVCECGCAGPACDGDPSHRGGCALAGCRTDADCGAGSFCALGNLNYFGDAVRGFGCLRADDECTTDADCKAPGTSCILMAEISDELGLKFTRRICSLPTE